MNKERKMEDKQDWVYRAPTTLQEQIARAAEYYHSAMVAYYGKEVVDGS